MQFPALPPPAALGSPGVHAPTGPELVPGAPQRGGLRPQASLRRRVHASRRRCRLRRPRQRVLFMRPAAVHLRGGRRLVDARVLVFQRRAARVSIDRALPRPVICRENMAHRALPLLYVNMGGEMLYILSQRLKAQRIDADKAHRVMSDIVAAMLGARLVNELFRLQPLYSARAMRSLFEKITHSSVMRLSPASMDKLYDLMRMVTKYQVWSCSSPRDLLPLTLKHLEAAGPGGDADHVAKAVQKHLEPLDLASLQRARYALLRFFQDVHVRVSVLLRSGAQRPNGKLAVATSPPPGAPRPGAIREWAPGGVLLYERSFATDDSSEPSGARPALGANMYSGSSSSSSSAAPSSSAPSTGLAELGLLLRLLGPDEEEPGLASLALDEELLS
ncbi:organic solute carrier partner 1 isoform X1 [Haemaphysalis longicornis]